MGPSGNNSVGGVWVDVAANLDPLNQQLNQAAQDAAQQGQRIGQAIATGVQQGYGGGISGPGYGPSYGGGVTGPGGSAAPPSGGGGAGGGGGGGGSPGNAAIQFNTVVATLSDIANTAQRFEQLGEAIGGLVSQMTKQQAELQRALQDVSISLSQQAALADAVYTSRTSGNQQVSSAPVERLNKYTERVTQGQKRLGEYGFQDLVEDFALSPFGPVGPIARQFGVTTTREQVQAQLEQDTKDQEQALKQVSGISRRERGRATTGGITEDVLGLGANTLGTGAPLDNVSAAAFRDLIQSNKELAELMRRLLSGSPQQRGQFIGELGGLPRDKVRY